MWGINLGVNRYIPSQVTMNIAFFDIDSKLILGAKSHGKKSTIYMLSAWACKNNLVLGWVKTAKKSNENTAILELLNMLNIAGNIITIYAMGTQKEISVFWESEIGK